MKYILSRKGYYDSKIARFMSEDTYRGQANDPLSLNLYTYCENNPIIYWDPTGHWPDWNKLWSGVKQVASVFKDVAVGAVSSVANTIAEGSKVLATAGSFVFSGFSEQAAIKTWDTATRLIDDGNKWVEKNLVTNKTVYNVSKTVTDVAQFAVGGSQLVKGVSSLAKATNLLSGGTKLVTTTGAVLKNSNVIVNSQALVQGLSSVAKGSVLLYGGNKGFDKSGSNSKLPGRKEAFNQAKRDAGIPKSQQPEKVKKVNLKTAQHEGGKPLKDAKGKIVTTREYTYTNNRGAKIIIQEHSAGHIKGNQGPHFNVRPERNTRTGRVTNTKDHYPFQKNKRGK